MISKKSPAMVSRRAQQMPRSSIRRLFNAAKALESRGEAVIRLDIGDPDFPLPERITEGIYGALRRGETHYSPMAGILQLRQAIAKHLTTRKGLDCESSEIVVAQGATQALNGAVLLTCDPGSTILLPQVYWPNYMQQIHLAGVIPAFYPLDVTFQPRLEALEEITDSSVRALLINSPGNPTGALFAPEAIRRLYRFAADHGLWIISDEAYTDYVFEGEYLSPLKLDCQLPREERRVIGVFSFSKSFAATGLRMGWTVLPSRATAQEMTFLNEPLTGSLTTPLQWGMLKALEQDDTSIRRESIRPRRDLAARLLKEAGIPVTIPQGGLFFFLDVEATGLTGDQFANRLLDEKRVAVVPGSGFGLAPASGGAEFTPHPLANRCVRVCFAVATDTLKEGLVRLGTFYRSLACEQPATN